MVNIILIHIMPSHDCKLNFKIKFIPKEVLMVLKKLTNSIGWKLFLAK